MESNNSAAGGGANPVALGIDVGGTKTRGIALSPEGDQLDEVTIPTAQSEKELISNIVSMIEDFSKKVGDVKAVGIGLAGMVTRDGVFVRGPHLPGVNNHDIASELKEFDKDLTIYVDNDANVAAWGEFQRGAGVESTNMTLLTFGTGIGGGIILNGELFRGARGFAGEFGHHVVVENGVICECGRYGCWEQYASGNALGRFARESLIHVKDSMISQLVDGEVEKVRGPHVVEAARKGDHHAHEVAQKYATWVAEGLANISNMLDVGRFVMGGGVADAGDVLLPLIQEAYEQIAYRPECEIVVASLGSKANAIGAADLAWRNYSV